MWGFIKYVMTFIKVLIVFWHTRWTKPPRAVKMEASEMRCGDGMKDKRFQRMIEEIGALTPAQFKTLVQAYLCSDANGIYNAACDLLDIPHYVKPSNAVQILKEKAEKARSSSCSQITSTGTPIWCIATDTVRGRLF